MLFESPNRIRDTLTELSQSCSPERRAAVCRELTKLHEQVLRGTIAGLLSALDESPRGEITLVVEGTGSETDDEEENDQSQEIDVSALLDARKNAGVSARDVAKELATLLEIDKREAYRRVVEHRMKSGT